MDDLLSPHFSLRELTITEHRDVDNSPRDEIIPHLTFLASRLENVRELVGQPVFVTSGYRCPALNKLVGGARDSDHTYGLAADIHAPGLTTTQLYEMLFANRDALGYRQLIWEFGSWVHIAYSVKGSGQKQIASPQSLVIYPHTQQYLAYVPGQIQLA
jgi:zinc D-Ala-D-Ala carboxypeptidase